jgi:hypothetical protein
MAGSTVEGRRAKDGDEKKETSIAKKKLRRSFGLLKLFKKLKFVQVLKSFLVSRSSPTTKQTLSIYHYGERQKVKHF